MESLMCSLGKKARIIIGLLLLLIYSNSFKISGSLGTAISFILLVIAIAFLILCRKYKTPEQIEKEKAEEAKKRLAEEQALNQIKAREAAEKARQEKLALQEEWRRTHEVFSTKIAGVTFKNDDGSSRQAYLEEFYLNKYSSTIDFEDYTYNDEPAVRVYYDGKCIGNIPKNNVKMFLHVMDNEDVIQEECALIVDRFDPDEDRYYDYSTGKVRSHKVKWVYHAELKIVYKKSGPKS